MPHGHTTGIAVLIDARSVSPGQVFDCDLAVVGSGPAGVAIADRLRGSKLSVVLLESGGFNYQLTTQRLYQLVRTEGAVADHTFEIRFLDPGVQAYAFTFG